MSAPDTFADGFEVPLHRSLTEPILLGGAPPIKSGSVSERCSGTSKPAAKLSGPLIRQPRRRS